MRHVNLNLHQHCQDTDSDYGSIFISGSGSDCDSASIRIRDSILGRVYSDSRAGFPICILRTSRCQQITHVNTSKAQGESQQQGESRTDTDTETGHPEGEGGGTDMKRESMKALGLPNDSKADHAHN